MKKKIIFICFLSVFVIGVTACGIYFGTKHRHTLEPIPDIEFTCLEDGSHGGTRCKTCGEILTKPEIIKAHHLIIDVDKEEPLCDVAGHESGKKCSVCGEIISGLEIIEALGHDLVHYDELAPTCTEDGHNAYDACTRCSYTTYEKVDMLGHDLVHHDGLSPTCTEDGHNAYDTCTRCSYTSFELLEKLGHNEVYTEENVIPATCLLDGSYEYVCTCKRCELELSRETVVIDKLGHDLLHHDYLDPTCTEDGHYEYDECTRCDYTTIVKIDMLGHNYVEDVCLQCGNIYGTKAYLEMTEVSGNYTINGCRDMNEIRIFTIPSYVVEINDYGLSNCINLSTLVIPNTVTRIGEGALSGCFSLSDISIPFTGEKRISVNSLNQYPLGYIFGETSYINSLAVTQNFYDTSLSSLSSAVFYLPADLDYVRITDCSYVPTGALWNCNMLLFVEIGNKTQTIADKALYGCGGLTNLVIPFVGNTRVSLNSVNVNPLGYIFGTKSYTGGVSTTQSYTSSGTTNTKSYYIPSSLVYVSITDPGVIPYGAFQNCTYLKNIELSDKTTDIGGRAFYNCSGINSIDIPNSVLSIGSSAFYKCIGFEELTIPSSVKTIGNSAFSGCSNLTSITLPLVGNSSTAENIFTNYFGDSTGVPDKLEMVTILSGTTSICDNSFKNCAMIKRIKLPNTLEVIGSSAFYGCSSLFDICIPNSVTTIGSSAFRKCVEMTDIYIPESVTSIGKYCFAGCTAIESLTLPIVGGDASINNLFIYSSSDTIPTTLKKIEILSGCTEIGDNAFESVITRSDLRVIIPQTISRIGDYAFSKCTSLVSFDTPFDTEEIGSYAFNGCTNLSTINFHDNLLTIGSYAFKNCSSLSSISLEDNVNEIGSNAFVNCSSLASVYLNYGLNLIGSYAFQNCTKLTSLAIPSTVTSIDNYILSGCTSLQSIALPLVDVNGASVSSFSYYFGSGIDSDDMPLLTDINILDGITIINSKAFGYWSKIEYITLPSTLESIGTSAFVGCHALQEIEIPNGVISIGKSAFSGCDSLKRITIPSSVTSIGAIVFDGCTSLINVYIPTSVTSIGVGIFRGCTSLQSFTLPFIGGDLTIEDLFIYSYSDSVPTSIKKIEILSSCTEIGDNAFERIIKRSDLEVIIPDTITRIGNYAFSKCTSLDFFKVPANVKEIGNYAFSGCTSLESLDLNEGLTTIGKYAFYDCNLLTSINIPSSVTSIGSCILYGCTSLANIRLPLVNASGEAVSAFSYYFNSQIASLTEVYIRDGITVINDSTFNGWKNIEYLSLPNTLESIGTESFFNCKALTEIEIPDNVTMIGESAFSGCSSLGKITLSSNLSSIGKSAFYNCSALTSITLPSSLTTLGEKAFQNCSLIKTVTIPSQVLTVGSYAFSGCTSLESVTMLEGITTIDSYAFNGCTALKTVDFADTITSIGSNAFASSGVTSINLPSELTYLGSDAFYSCKSLTYVRMHNKIETIGAQAFRNCSNLTAFYYTGTVNEWNLITKGSNWKTNTGITEIYCSDDTITL